MHIYVVKALQACFPRNLCSEHQVDRCDTFERAMVSSTWIHLELQ